MTGNEDAGYLAERLRWLFDEVRRPDGRPFTLREAAAGVNAIAGQELVSFQYLALLRSGKRRNPSFTMMAALARWFGVDTGYFSPFAWVVPRRCNSVLAWSGDDAIPWSPSRLSSRRQEGRPSAAGRSQRETSGQKSRTEGARRPRRAEGLTL